MTATEICDIANEISNRVSRAAMELLNHHRKELAADVRVGVGGDSAECREIVLRVEIKRRQAEEKAHDKH
jgi:hypothetical protein